MDCSFSSLIVSVRQGTLFRSFQPGQTYFSAPPPSMLYAGFTDRLYFAGLRTQHQEYYNIPEINQIIKEVDIKFNSMLLRCNQSHSHRVTRSTKSDLLTFGAFYLMTAESPSTRNQRMRDVLRQPIPDRNLGMLPPQFEVTPLVTYVQNQMYESLSEENPTFDTYEYIRNQLQAYTDLTEFHIKNLGKRPFPRAIWPYAERSRFALYYYNDSRLFDEDTGYNGYQNVTFTIVPERFSIFIKAMIPDTRSHITQTLTEVNPTISINDTCKRMTIPPTVILLESIDSSYPLHELKYSSIYLKSSCISWRYQTTCSVLNPKRIYQLPDKIVCT